MALARFVLNPLTMIWKIKSCALNGFNVLAVDVEVSVQRGMPKFEIIGLAQEAVKEGKKRILTALETVGLTFEKKSIVVNLAPACVKKDGSHFDLPIALCLMKSSGMLDSKFDKHMIVGELSLDASVQSVKGLLAMADFAKQQHHHGIVVPQSGCQGLELVKGLECLTLEHLSEVINHQPLKRFCEIGTGPSEIAKVGDWSEVMGQAFAKRALEIAVAGGHHVLLVGPPGVGKTFMLNRLVGIMPELNEKERLEVAKIYSCYFPQIQTHSIRPFRAPHHHASLAGLVGGGQPYRPGEYSLAHKGVLFLDEMVEFRRDVLESLREPLESGYVSVARASGVFKAPASFMLVGATNLCPCGNLGHEQKKCLCSQSSIDRYRRKLSNALLDRIDLVVLMDRPKWDEVWSKQLNPSSSEQVRQKVLRAQKIQRDRQRGLNARVTGKTIRKHALASEATLAHLKDMVQRYAFSVRAMEKLLRVSRTIADIEGVMAVEMNHLSEALQYRRWVEDRFS